MLEVTDGLSDRARGWRQVNVVKDLEFCHRAGFIAGTRLVEAIHPAWGVPVGMAYYKETYDLKISIDYINVVEQLRRMGIGRAILASIAREHPGQMLVTSMATDLAKPFLPKVGFSAPSEERVYWAQDQKILAEKRITGWV